MTCSSRAEQWPQNDQWMGPMSTWVRRTAARRTGITSTSQLLGLATTLLYRKHSYHCDCSFSCSLYSHNDSRQKKLSGNQTSVLYSVTCLRHRKSYALPVGCQWISLGEYLWTRAPKIDLLVVSVFHNVSFLLFVVAGKSVSVFENSNSKENHVKLDSQRKN